MIALEPVFPVLAFINARGDHLLNLPTVRAIAHRYPKRLTLLCRRGAYQTFFECSGVARVVEVDVACQDMQYVFDGKDAAARIGRCDLLLSLHPWFGQAMVDLIDCLQPELTIGYDPTFDVAIDLDYTKHNADLGFELAEEVGSHMAIDSFSQAPCVSDSTWDAVQFVCASLPVVSPLVVVHADTKNDKMWSPQLFSDFLDELLSSMPQAIVLDVGATDWGLDSGSVGDRVIHCGRLDLRSAIALTGIADLFVGVDSCFLHAADLFRVPGVGLFGPTSPAEFGFRFSANRSVSIGDDMNRLRVGDVLAAVTSLARDVFAVSHLADLPSGWSERLDHRVVTGKQTSGVA